MNHTSDNPDYIVELLHQLQFSSPENSLKILGKAIQTYPNDARLWLLIAGEHAQATRWDMAEASYITALQIAPDFAIARFQLGLLQLTSSRPGAAMATWHLLETLPENHYLRLFKQGLELLAADSFDAAKQKLQAGLENNQENPALNVDMQRILGEIAKLQDDNDTTPPDDGEPSSDTHFLLSNYRR